MLYIYFLFFPYSILASDYCSSIQDCYNCSISANDNTLCSWSSSSCHTNRTRTARYSSSSEWWTYFTSCNDTDSNIIHNNYCGDIDKAITNKEDNVTIALPSINGEYGTKNILCKYIIKNDLKSNNIAIELKNKINLSFMMYINIFLNNDQTISKIIENDNFNMILDKVEQVEVYYYSSRSFSSSPFEISVYTKEKKNNLSLYIAIGIIVLACIACSIFIYCFSKRLSKRPPQENGGNSEQNKKNEADLIKEQNKKKIEFLLSSSMKPETYSDYLINKKNDNEEIEVMTACTICLEDFKNGSQVIETPCYHLYHAKCITNWLYKNVMHPKCPNCNYNLIEIKKEQKSDVMIIQIKKKQSHRNSSVTRISDITSENEIRTNNLIISQNFSNTNNSNRRRYNHNDYLVNSDRSSGVIGSSTSRVNQDIEG